MGRFAGASIGCYGSTEERHLIQPEEGFLEEVTFELGLGSREGVSGVNEGRHTRPEQRHGHCHEETHPHTDFAKSQKCM